MWNVMEWNDSVKSKVTLSNTTGELIIHVTRKAGVW